MSEIIIPDRRLYIVKEYTSISIDGNVNVVEQYYAFTSENKAIDYLKNVAQLTYQEFIDDGIIIDNKVAYIDGHSVNFFGANEEDNHKIYYDITIEGSVPVIINYDKDWEDIKNNVEYVSYTIPDTLYIVKEILEVPGGCCPDLPDTLYVNKADAKRRISEWSTSTYNDLLKDYPSVKQEINSDNTEYIVYVTNNEDIEIYYFRLYMIPEIKVIA